MMTKLIIGRRIYERLVNTMEGATGLDGANDVDMRDPFSAFQGFKDAFANLSAALIPIESISSGLVSFANAINTFANAFRNSEDWAKYTVGGVAAGGAGLAAYGIGKSVYALLAAGPSLQTAAVMLQQAAVAQGGGIGGAGATKGKAAGWMGLLGRIGGVLGIGTALRGDTRGGGAGDWASVPGAQMTNEFFANRANERKEAKTFKHGANPPNPRGGYHSGEREREASLDGFLNYAEQTGQKAQAALSVTATPTVDTASISLALDLARQLASALGGIPAMAAQAAASANSAIRQAHTDFGGEAAP